MPIFKQRAAEREAARAASAERQERAAADQLAQRIDEIEAHLRAGGAPTFRQLMTLKESPKEAQDRINRVLAEMDAAVDQEPRKQS